MTDHRSSLRRRDLLRGGLALGALGVGIYASVRQNVDTQYLLDNAPCRSADCNQRRDREDTWHTVSIVGYVAAGALAVTAAVVLATAPSSRPASHGASLQLRCGPWVTAPGAACGGVF